jgi:hypothetical protein
MELNERGAETQRQAQKNKKTYWPPMNTDKTGVCYPRLSAFIGGQCFFRGNVASPTPFT